MQKSTHYTFCLTLKLLGVRKVGFNCFEMCDRIEGNCTWCGTEGMCCSRTVWTGPDCDGSFGGIEHECVDPPSKNALGTLRQNKLNIIQMYNQRI